MQIELTIFTPFGPKFSYANDLWKKAIEVIDPPWATRILVIDDSGGSTDVRGLLAWACHKGHNVSWLVAPSAEPDNDLGRYITKRLITLWQTALRSIGSEYLLSLEHDVLPPLGAYQRMKAILDEKPQAGCVALAMRSRQYLHYMAFELVSLDPYVLGRTIDQDGTHEVGMVHTGCTLFRGEALQSITPRFLIPGAYAHEHALMYDMLKAGWSIWTDNRKPQIQHYRDAASWV